MFYGKKSIFNKYKVKIPRDERNSEIYLSIMTTNYKTEIQIILNKGNLKIFHFNQKQGKDVHSLYFFNTAIEVSARAMRQGVANMKKEFKISFFGKNTILYLWESTPRRMN